MNDYQENSQEEQTKPKRKKKLFRNVLDRALELSKTGETTCCHSEAPGWL